MRKWEKERGRDKEGEKETRGEGKGKEDEKEKEQERKEALCLLRVHRCRWIWAHGWLCLTHCQADLSKHHIHEGLKNLLGGSLTQESIYKQG